MFKRRATRDISRRSRFPNTDRIDRVTKPNIHIGIAKQDIALNQKFFYGAAGNPLV